VVKEFEYSQAEVKWFSNLLTCPEKRSTVHGRFENEYLFYCSALARGVIVIIEELSTYDYKHSEREKRKEGDLF
jgi:hypothetical protein